MKIVKILLSHSKNMTEDAIKAFLAKNMPAELLTGLEYDDPKAIERALKLLGLTLKGPGSTANETQSSKHNEQNQKEQGQKSAAM